MENVSLRQRISEQYKSESDLAREMGWTKQKLSKTILGKRSPKISDINALSKALGIPIAEVISFFE